MTRAILLLTAFTLTGCAINPGSIIGAAVMLNGLEKEPCHQTNTCKEMK